MSNPNSPAIVKPFFIRDRTSIIVALTLSLASAVSWITSYSMMVSSSEMVSMGVASIVSSLSLTTVAFFELTWITGMIAMMFPAMIPIVLFYTKVVTRTESNPLISKLLGTPLFLLGYLATYGGLGLLAYLAVYTVLSSAAAFPFLNQIGAIAPSSVLILAGIYQISPPKIRSLSQCISPMGFFTVHSRRGLLGSIRMGFSHGTYCVGCCWAFMLVMLAVAAMSLPFMATLAAIIAMEKVVIRGARWFNIAISGFFFILAAVVIFAPNALII